jgi:hypothetical protein
MKIDKYFGNKTHPWILSNHIKTDMIRSRDDKYVDLMAEIRLLNERIEELEYENRGICSRIQDSLSKLFSMPVMLWVQVIRPGISRVFSLWRTQEGHLQQDETHGQNTGQDDSEKRSEYPLNFADSLEAVTGERIRTELPGIYEQIIRSSITDITPRRPSDFYYNEQRLIESRQ